MKLRNNMHILLLKGGFGSEREVSQKSAQACYEALININMKVTQFDIASMNIADLINLKPDICFNALHGNIGENGSIQGFLNLLHLPYTHSGVEASSIAMNKMHFRRIITNATENSNDPIHFPRLLEIKQDGQLTNTDLNDKIVLKPINGGSSVGVEIVNRLALKKFSEKNLKNSMAEIFVGNKELTVTVLKNRPLCVTEIKANQSQEFYNYKAKYEKDGSLHIIPAKIPKKIYDQSMSWALRAHNILGCKGISRSDFRYDTVNNKLYMLEINTQPGMTDTSLSPEQAQFCNISFEEMIRIILKEASYG